MRITTVDNKRAAACRVEDAIGKIEGVEDVQFWKAWENGLDYEHLWTKSGREILQLSGRG